MEVCGHVFKSSHWRWLDPPHGQPIQRILSSGLHFTISNPISRTVYMISSFKCAGSRFSALIGHRAYWERQWQQQAFYSSSSKLRDEELQLRYSPSRDRHQGPKRRDKDKVETHFCNGTRLSLTADISRTRFFTTSAVASGSVSLDETSSSTREEHIEQLEKFYDENEFLFVDETWGALGQDEENAGGSIPLPEWLEEKFSLSLAAGRVQRVSQVLVWGGSAAFVQQLSLACSPASVVVTHFSLSVLAAVKEMNDDVKCWHGDIEDLPASYGPFDCVFLNSLVATAYSPEHLLRSVAGLCKPGVSSVNITKLCSIAISKVFLDSVSSPAYSLQAIARLCKPGNYNYFRSARSPILGSRIVICYTEGKNDRAECRDKNPHLILHNLPDMADLEAMINPLPLTLVELQDEPAFYQATLEVTGSSKVFHTGDSPGVASDANNTPSRTTSHQKFPLRARGHIVQGFGRGSKQMGIPTANIDPAQLPSEVLELPNGVYFGWAQQVKADGLDDGVYKMVMNIGSRPTFADGEQVTVEVNIRHSFSADFYGKELSIIVLGFIRDEMRFKSLDDLVFQINSDIATAEKVLDEDEMFQFASDDYFVRR